MIRRLYFGWRYLVGQTPWDTEITPPEIVDLIEKEHLPPGRAIDLGCGTGTNAIYLAQHGWKVVGIDYVAQAVRRAQRKARQAGVSMSTRFVTGDVTRLAALDLGGTFDLAVDVGCVHSLLPQGRTAYAQGLARVVGLNGVLMLYVFRPTSTRLLGLEPAEVEQLFAPAFRLVWSSLGQDRAAGVGSAWYRFERGK